MITSNETIALQGLHHHYKGGRYLLLTIAETHEHNGDLDAIYVSLMHGKYVTRPLRKDSRNQDSWTDLVKWPDDELRPRFTHENNISEQVLNANMHARYNVLKEERIKTK